MTLQEVKEKYPLSSTIIGEFYDEPISNERGLTTWKDVKDILLNPPEYCIPRVIDTQITKTLLFFWYQPICGYADIGGYGGLLVYDPEVSKYEFYNPDTCQNIYSIDEAINLFNDNPNAYSTWDAVKTAFHLTI